MRHSASGIILFVGLLSSCESSTDQTERPLPDTMRRQVIPVSEPVAKPNTMLRATMREYRTDGVLLFGDMAETMVTPANRDQLRQMVGNVDFGRIGPGETAEDFAKRNGTDLETLRLMNPLQAMGRVTEGDFLCFNATHRILDGETLSFIARLHQTDEATLQALNDLDADRVQAGADLRVPAVHEMTRSGLAIYRVFPPRD